MKLFDHRKHEKLESKERYDMLAPTKTLIKLGLKEGLTGADIGCGTGFFTIPAAKILGNKGNIYAFDIQKEMLTYLRMKIDTPNVVPILIEQKAENSSVLLPLKDKLLDFVLISFVIHEVEDKHKFISEVKRVLKQNGKIIIMEWIVKEEHIGPPKEHRVAEDILIKLLKDSNFTIEQMQTINNSNYAIIGNAMH